jgi:hypothetical protein
MAVTAKVAPHRHREASTTRSSARRRQCPKCCAPFFTFVVFGLVFVPIAVFAISAFFGVILWAIECDEYKLEVGEELANGSDVCSFYEWWLYITGNLVGVSIATVTVSSNHAVAAILDLLISVWSLTVAGLVVGLVGSFTWVNILTQGADSSLTRGFNRAFGIEDAARELAGTAIGLEWDQFLELCRDKEIRIDEARLREIYDNADRDESGSISSNEVERLLALLRAEAELGDASKSGMQSLTARIDTLEAKLDMIIAKLDNVSV